MAKIANVVKVELDDNEVKQAIINFASEKAAQQGVGRFTQGDATLQMVDEQEGVVWATVVFQREI